VHERVVAYGTARPPPSRPRRRRGPTGPFPAARSGALSTLSRTYPR
jgi:hypothetical protein